MGTNVHVCNPPLQGELRRADAAANVCPLFNILHMHVEKVQSTAFVGRVSIVKARTTISVDGSTKPNHRGG